MVQCFFRCSSRIKRYPSKIRHFYFRYDKDIFCIFFLEFRSRINHHFHLPKRMCNNIDGSNRPWKSLKGDIENHFYLRGFFNFGLVLYFSHCHFDGWKYFPEFHLQRQEPYPKLLIENGHFHVYYVYAMIVKHKSFIYLQIVLNFWILHISKMVRAS